MFEHQRKKTLKMFMKKKIIRNELVLKLIHAKLERFVLQAENLNFASIKPFPKGNVQTNQIFKI